MMRKTLAALALLALTLLFGGFAPAAHGAPSCGNCSPTLVTIDTATNTATFTTDAVPKSDCVRADHSSTGECVLKIFGQYHVEVVTSPGSPTTVSGDRIFDCPCTAQFWTHAGQWHPYSAMSDVF